MCIDFDKWICTLKMETYLAYSFVPLAIIDKTYNIEFMRLIAFCVLQINCVIITELFHSYFMYLCVCFSYDLHLTIKNPLYPSHKRKKLYTIILVIIFFFIIGLTAYSIDVFSDGGRFIRTFNRDKYIGLKSNLKKF